MRKKCLVLELGLQKNTKIFSLNDNFCILSDNLLFLVRTLLLMFSTVFYKYKNKANTVKSVFNATISL